MWHNKLHSEIVSRPDISYFDYCSILRKRWCHFVLLLMLSFYIIFAANFSFDLVRIEITALNKKYHQILPALFFFTFSLWNAKNNVILRCFVNFYKNCNDKKNFFLVSINKYFRCYFDIRTVNRRHIQLLRTTKHNLMCTIWTQKTKSIQK